MEILCSTHGCARHTARCSTERVMEIAEAQVGHDDIKRETGRQVTAPCRYRCRAAQREASQPAHMLPSRTLVWRLVEKVERLPVEASRSRGRGCSLALLLDRAPASPCLLR